MKKVNAYKNVNRNTTFNDFRNYPINTIASDRVMNQRWLHDETPQVKVIELNSEDSDDHPSDEDDKFDHKGNNMNGNNESLDDSVEFSTKYRNKETTRSDDDIDNELEEVIADFVNSGIYGTDAYPYKYKSKNHHSNFFTVINKPFGSSDSSLDDLGITECTDAEDYRWNTCNTHIRDRLSLDENKSKKSTIWIYSIKNKHLLSEKNTLELVNLPCHESTSSTSHSSENYCEDSDGDAKEIIRVGSPVPATYIPRLNLLSPRLPTVTEVTEPDKSICEETYIKNRIGSHKRINGWFEGEVNPRNGAGSDEKSGDTSVSSHIFLSPRERRSRFKHTNPTKSAPGFESAKASFDDANREKTNHVKIKTEAEINGISDNKVDERNSFISEVIDKNKIFLSGVDINNKPDYEKEFANRRRPRIVIPTKTPREIKNISNPIERLDNNSWIYEENKDMQIDESKEFQLIPIENTVNSQNTELACPEDNAGNRLWARNVSLLKPAEWKEYRAITNSIPSLQLSIDTESKTQTWFCRFITCFKCCK
ncbi:unnamed protein product [Chilo suppressalis]|uniref:Spaetzle domain-containing protein n=1 Tax=Chilo suppressalis TaxID=168631 RepID=A0ABN8E9Y6_CHISP|nr:unnamed protein product [Chilo suppressalis]